jgi:hypothetical protein
MLVMAPIVPLGSTAAKQIAASQTRFTVPNLESLADELIDSPTPKVKSVANLKNPIVAPLLFLSTLLIGEFHEHDYHRRSCPWTRR